MSGWQCEECGKMFRADEVHCCGETKRRLEGIFKPFPDARDKRVKAALKGAP